ncbi:pyridoxal phosphate-dependent aminotransferase [Virgibacillus dokdonensis]|uniref:Pyridoxal phosphate-dependent aminotransferase n=1 Tax=Virgibacillus dokdonensis TaxID=302167 RepID=A0ABU7VKR4_9BACI
MGIYTGRIIRLDFGEPSFPCPPEVKAESIKYITNPDCYYSPIKGENQLLENIKQYLLNVRNIKVKKELITVTSGGLRGINSIIRCLKNEGVKRVYYPDPGFPPYQFLGDYNDIEMLSYPIKNEKDAVRALIFLAKTSSEKSSAFILTSPNNPNGITFSQASWEILNESMIKQYIICDNSFESFIFREENDCLPPIGENIFHAFSFSKSFSMADYRVGYVISPSIKWSEVVSRDHWFTQLSTSVISQKAAIGALNCKSDYLYNTKNAVLANLVSSVNLLSTARIETTLPEGGFFLWVNIEDTECNSDEFVRYALEKYKVSLISGSSFGENGNGYVRINCATDHLALEEGLDRFIQCYKERASRNEYIL